MSSFIRNILIFGCLVLMGYIFKIYYIDPIPVMAESPVATVSTATQMSVLPTATPELNLISPIFTREVKFWQGNIISWSVAYGVDPNLAATVMQIESCGNPYARSSSGAMGLFQVMPFHFDAYEDPYNPDTNAYRGLSYLYKAMGNSGGDPRLAMAGYNGGLGAITRSEWNWANETQRYVRYGYPIYLDAISGVTESTALNDWYGSYGAGICRDASNALGLN